MIPGQYIEAVVESYGTGSWLGTINVRLLGVENQNSIVEHVRMVVPFVNETSGMYRLPEKNDLVYIVFVSESFSEAVCVGSPIPLNKDLTKQMKSDNTFKQMVTKGGFQIQVSDQKDHEQIKIESKKGLMIVLDEAKESICIGQSDEEQYIKIQKKDKTVHIQAKTNITITNKDATISLEKDTLKVQAKTIQLNSTTLEVNTKKETTMKSLNTTIKSNNQTVVHGNLCEVSADTKQEVKGGIIKIG